jgi:hypothetical protein
MSLPIKTRGPHLDDGALLRLLDGEASAAERDGFATHVEACALCQGRRGLLAGWSEGASELLARSDAAPRGFARAPARPLARVPWTMWAAAAAGVLLVGGTVASAAPLRTWVIGRLVALEQVLHFPARPRPIERRPAEQAAPPAASTPVGAVSFTPEGDVLLVRIATRQVAGSLVLEASTTPTASAVVRGQGEHEAVVVLPDELKIANTPASRATYRLTLPARLARVVVVIGSELPLSLAPVPPGESRVFDLTARRP